MERGLRVYCSFAFTPARTLTNLLFTQAKRAESLWEQDRTFLISLLVFWVQCSRDLLHLIAYRLTGPRQCLWLGARTCIPTTPTVLKRRQ